MHYIVIFQEAIRIRNIITNSIIVLPIDLVNASVPIKFISATRKYIYYHWDLNVTLATSAHLGRKRSFNNVLFNKLPSCYLLFCTQLYGKMWP